METIKRIWQAIDGPVLRRAAAEALIGVLAVVVSQIAAYFGSHPLSDPLIAYVFARAIAFAERVIFQAREELRKNPA